MKRLLDAIDDGLIAVERSSERYSPEPDPDHIDIYKGFNSGRVYLNMFKSGGV